MHIHKDQCLANIIPNFHINILNFHKVTGNFGTYLVFIVHLICVTKHKISSYIVKWHIVLILKLKIQLISDILVASHNTFYLNQKARYLRIKIGIMIQRRLIQYMTSFNRKMTLPNLGQKSQRVTHMLNVHMGFRKPNPHVILLFTLSGCLLILLIDYH